jgi:SET domain-containing protein
MSLKQDEYLDATKKGGISRFINHSCNPNCVLQKWVVGKRLRMGIFTRRDVQPGEEVTFDYKFERYGAAAQKCLCGEANCKGYIGVERKSSSKTPGDGDENEYDSGM